MDNLNNTHYICTGNCGGVSDKPGVCQSKFCVKHNQPLDLCDCKDGKHYGRQHTDKKDQPMPGSPSK